MLCGFEVKDRKSEEKKKTTAFNASMLFKHRVDPMYTLATIGKGSYGF